MGRTNKVNTSDGARNDFFGFSVAISDNYALIGAWGDGNNFGSAYIFRNEFQLPITLSSFTAMQITDNLSQINWVTQSENGLIGFNIYKNTNNGMQAAVKINPSIIDATNTTEEQSYVFIDTNVNFSHIYYYWLESLELDGNSKLFGPISLNFVSPDINDLPQSTLLKRAYPNPFNPSTTISFDVKESEKAYLTIYNLKGQKLVSKNFEAGHYEYRWHADKFTSGVYFYKLQTMSYSKINKILMLK